MYSHYETRDNEMCNFNDTKAQSQANMSVSIHFICGINLVLALDSQQVVR